MQIADYSNSELTLSLCAVNLNELLTKKLIKQDR